MNKLIRFKKYALPLTLWVVFCILIRNYWLIFGAIGVVGGIYCSSLLHPKTEDQETPPSQKEASINLLVIGLAPIIISSIFSYYYQHSLSHDIRSYVIAGSVSVLINLIYISIVTLLIKKDENLKTYGSYTAIIFTNVTLIIPFTVFYILSSFVFSGLSLPFEH